MPDDNITVLILKGVKRVKSIKVNRKRIRFAVLGGTIFSVAFVISVGLNVYQFMNADNSLQEAVSTQQNSQTETGINTEENTGFTDNDLTAELDTQPEDNGSNTAPPDEHGIAPQEDLFANDLEPDILGIQNLNETVGSSGLALKISFSIVKKDQSFETISGKFVIVAKTDDPDKPYLSYPEAELNPDGSVRDFRSGAFFSMQFRTPKSGIIQLTNNLSSFEYYRIYIYSDTGDLLLQKTRLISSSF